MHAQALAYLGADIRFLGEQLGKTIRRLDGEDAFQLVEQVRAEAKALRTAPSLAQARALRDRLGTLELRQLRQLIRAFSVYFDLINLAEQQARVRSLRQREAAQKQKPGAESIEAAVQQLQDRGISRDEVIRHLEDALVVPVFTAHPSEARRRTILDKLGAIATQLDRLEYGQLGPGERAATEETIAEEIETFWLTETVRVSRPSVLDEVSQLLGLVEGRLLEIVPRVYRQLDAAIARVYREDSGSNTTPATSGHMPAFLRFGSWIGGDRDGHPHVTHDITAAAIRKQCDTVLRYYAHRVGELARRLSHSARGLRNETADTDDALSHEPCRARCRLIEEKLQKTRAWSANETLVWGAAQESPPDVYFGRTGLLDDLRRIQSDLHNAGATAAANGALQDAIRQVEVFGVHLLQLDVRQHSGRHASAIDEILRNAGVCDDYSDLSADARFERLSTELEQRRPLVPTHLEGFTADTIEVVRTFRLMSAVLERLNPDVLGPYIISSTTEPAHLLEVLVLAREARLFRPAEGISRIDIIPLFEALEPLQSGRAILEKLFSVPAYRKQIELRGQLQEVMIGYSDSNKESGSLRSAWALYQAQSHITELGRGTGIVIRFFHGRGGAIGRGGGPANHAILAQPRGTVDGRLRMTEQGEMIADRYGHPAIAERHLQQVLNAVLRTSFPVEAEQPEPEWLRAVDMLADTARRQYRELVYEDREFLTYFEQATCIDEISRLKIGSRPARRAATRGIDQLRAIPWVFSWMQSRHTLPGWYGLGTAVREYLDANPDGMLMLREMYARWPFWTTLIDNAQMILAKADMTIARLYADMVQDAALADRVYTRIAGEFAAAVDAVCRITGQSVLLEASPVLRTSIERRNPYVDPLSFIQLVLLGRLRSTQTHDHDLETAVLESINGIASGLKNTG